MYGCQSQVLKTNKMIVQLRYCTYTKKNIAESDCGVACHRKRNSVGRYIFGCLIAVHILNMCCLEVSRKLKPVLGRLGSFNEA